MPNTLRHHLSRWRSADAARRSANAAATPPEGFWFPGRWVSGVALILGPVLMLTGVLLRVRFHFFFPDQLAAYDRHPALITAAYACFATGNVLLWPAVIALARIIGRTQPLWALWGGSLVMFGLFTRAFQFGTDHLAFNLVDVHGVDAMIAGIDGYYRAWRDAIWHPFRTLSGPAFIGWIVLAIGAYRSGALGVGRCIALGLMSMLALGTLKGTQVPQSLVATIGLCIAFIPLGITVLRNGPRPTNRALFWLTVLFCLHILGYFFAPRG